MQVGGGGAGIPKQTNGLDSVAEIEALSGDLRGDLVHEFALPVAVPWCV
jgi:hypothetical protein